MPQDGFFNGLKAGAKGLANGLARAGAGAVSLGFWDVNGPYKLSQAELGFGAGVSQGIGEVSGSIAIGALTCGAAGMGKYAGAAVKMYDMAGGAVDTARAGADMYANGVNMGNAMQMVAGGTGAVTSAVSTCFTEGTQIVVGEIYDENDVFVQYVTVNIEDIQVGDYVLACDVETGEVSLCPVTETYVRTSDHIRYLTVEDENGIIQTFETTDSHPVWVVTDEPDPERLAREFVDENGVILYHENIPVTENGFYVEAKDLRVGDVFVGPNGELVTLTENSREEFENGATVYNFEVEGNHNYYVIASIEAYEYGATAVLVHNANYGPEFKPQTAQQLASKLNTNKRDYERNIKPLIIRDARAELGDNIMNQIGKNPDIALTKDGLIGIQSTIPGNNVSAPTSLQISWYSN